MINEVKENNVYFAKLKKGAKIPTKRLEDAGYDIYACFDEDYIEIPPHTTKMIPTGICSACSTDYVFVLKERGSNGSKGICERCGVIDSGYRSEWFVPLTNSNDVSVFISKLGNDTPFKKSIHGKSITYPYEKGIAQALILPVPIMNIKEITPEELQAIPSKRGKGKLGSSGK